MATKQKSKSTSKPKSSKPRASKHPEFVVGVHPFGPKDKVGIHPSWAVEVERRDGREPAPKPLQTATVNAQGQLKVKLPKGNYAAAAEVERRSEFSPHTKPEKVWVYSVFTVK